MKSDNRTSNIKKWRYAAKTDAALIQLYSNGHADAFESLYLRHKDKLFHFLCRQCSDTTIAEELAHDAWIAVINQIEKYQADYKFVTWLYRIAHNKLVDHWRKNGLSAKTLYEELHSQLRSQAEECQSSSIDIDEIFKKLETLSFVQTEALLLKIEGFTHNEIATITQSNPETVKSRLRYAKNSLRVALEAIS